MNANYVTKAAKIIVNTCVNRTVVDGIDNLTSSYGDTPARKVIKFIGREGLGFAITCATKKVIDEAIDDVADKIADIYVRFKESKEEE